MLESVTVGESHKMDKYADPADWNVDIDGDGDLDGEDIVSGAYTTIANNNGYGTLTDQVTVGASFNKMSDGAGGVLYNEGRNTTKNAAVNGGVTGVDGDSTGGRSAEID